MDRRLLNDDSAQDIEIWRCLCRLEQDIEGRFRTLETDRLHLVFRLLFDLLHGVVGIGIPGSMRVSRSQKTYFVYLSAGGVF